MSGTRKDWIDCAKALSILLVILYHIDLYFVAVGWNSPLLGGLSSLFQYMRMPLFFFISGAFAVRLINKDNPGSKLAFRISNYLYLYLLWSVVRHYVLLADPSIAHEAQDGMLPPILNILFYPFSGLWFLYALGLYYSLAFILRRLPPGLHLVLAMALAATVESGAFRTDNFVLNNLAQYYVFFAMGGELARLLFERAEKVPLAAWAGAILAFPVLVGAARVTGLLDVPIVVLLADLAGLAAGIGMALFIARTPLRSAVATIGRNTLPIYVLHALIISITINAMLRFDLTPGYLPVALIAAICVVLPLGIHAICARRPLAWLFQSPLPDLLNGPPRKAAPKPAPLREASLGRSA